MAQPPPPALGDERGAAALLIAAGMVLLLGMAALAVDYGLGVNERRQDQTAVDVGVMAAALDAYLGEDGVRDAALSWVRRNLPNAYSDIDWFNSWASCTDPGRPPDFFPVPDPSGTGAYDCVSVRDVGEIRVRIPDQLVAASFGSVMGVDLLVTSASAEASLWPEVGDADIVPFGVTGTAPSGSEVCLRAQQAIEPCTNSASGTARRVDSPLFGNPSLGTPRFCARSSPVFATNIRLGVDHFIRSHETGTATVTDPFVPDQCGNFAPNRPQVRHSISGLWTGLIDGSLSTPSTPRLQQGNNVKRNLRSGLNSYPLDNRPLWDYLVSGYGGVATCAPANFTDPDELVNTANLVTCLQDAAAAGARIFGTSLFASPRFALIPQFYEPDWPAVTGDRTIRAFRPAVIAGMFFSCTGATQASCGIVFYPGGDSSSDLCMVGGPGGCQSVDLDQVSVFLLHDNALPLDEILEGPNGNLGPFQPDLTR